MMETLDNLKEIVKNAPEIATHIDFNGHYWHNSSAFYWLCCDDGSTTSNADIGNHIRKLSDVKQIIELMELNQNMHTTVAGYLWGKDWAHWNEFNAGKFKL